MQNKIAIIGLGYVGLPLAHAFADKYQVVGIDIDSDRISELNSGVDRTLELTKEQMEETLANGIIYSSDIKASQSCNIYIVTVPTPINAENKPDLTPLIQSSRSIGKVLKKDDIVIYESTVYPGVTEDICVPELEKSSGLVFNKDFFCGYSPERINPGDKEHTITKILKVTAGSTPKIAQKVDALYASIITAGTHLAPTIKVAEAAKVIENTQRDVNIALMNELAMIFDMMGIDTSAVLEAAGTKWNFIKLTPGLVGGHCIGVDPYYLTHKAQSLGYTPNLILGARNINNGMSKLIVEKTIKYMVKADKQLKDAKVLVMGITFKENCPDMRNTKVRDIILELEEFGCKVEVYDPWIEEEERVKNIYFIDTLPFQKHRYEAIIVAVGHNEFRKLTQEQYAGLSSEKPVIIDVKGIVDSPTWRL